MATDALVPAQNGTLMTVIERLSSNPNVDIDKLKQLLEMQERWEANRDKSTLRYALAEFKKNPPEIIKKRIANIKSDKGNYTYNFADLENIASAIEGDLAATGVTHSWTLAETNGLIFVTCVLKLGVYEEPGVTLSAPPDNSVSKNPIQAKGSTISYLEKYTLLAATGMAAGMPDTDGNKSGATVEGYAEHLTLIQHAKSLIELKNYHHNAVKAARAVKDSASEKDFTLAKDKRRGELEADNAGN
jgi:hypothetical protein